MEDRNSKKSLDKLLASAYKEKLRKVKESIESHCKEQFNMPLTIDTEFSERTVDALFNLQTLNINDGVSTPLEQKGSGMQRAVMLSMLRTYADIICDKSNKEEKVKSLLLILDEPENCLHPKAQSALLESLIKISQSQQVFIATHSPYFFHAQDIQNIGFYLFNTENNTNKVESVKEIILLPWSPTWGEINYIAYGMPTIELHNELYGFLHDPEKNKSYNNFLKNNKQESISTFDAWLKPKLDDKDLKEYKREGKQSQKITLCTYIRHQIHHPENKKNDLYKEEDLKKSIDILIKIIKKEKQEEKNKQEELLSADDHTKEECLTV